MSPTQDRQINVRVAPEVYRVLRAAVVAEGHRGMQALLTPVIEQKAKDLETDPAIKAVAEVLAKKAEERVATQGRTQRGKR